MECLCRYRRSEVVNSSAIIISRSPDSPQRRIYHYYNEFLADSFSTAAFAAGGMLMPSWLDIHDAPITSKSVRDEEDVVQSVHAMIDREIAAWTSQQDVFVFGLSHGGAVFSGFLPFNSSFAVRVTAEAKKTPVLWIHGRADSLIPIEAGRDGTKFLRGLGMSCKFKVYDRLGHALEYYERDYYQRWDEKFLQSGREGLVHMV